MKNKVVRPQVTVSHWHNLLWVLGSVILLGQADKGPMVAGHGGVGSLHQSGQEQRMG